ncbi:thiol reductant ABC exporter subunit CydC [Aeromicrobium wangtongii]|uniref:Thiol reductant ABC exporter subunit CydC n=1 Tax=Aeromicrobium wangtongii TaxID=2969247 RepID=A0ABY5M9S7_9ACTN|nr:thiol reductant ABC exporter subunit CydC [Aeromicrobium wangtongii]MCD9198509.1 thiol reductant ABC exporter subunit CydC [Aeromicrobium wangtongii]UUP12536.1 thiol reductant ABC exporter subunit CydC [Aeromicrobium wangtongii]
MKKMLWGRTFGVLSELAGIALLLVSAWLIVRAAERPPVLYLMVAIVGVRFFGLSRAALRYVERLLTHDATFARITEARVAVYRDLDRIAPGGMPAHRRGDLVSRVVSDVDAIQDRVLRLRGPWVVAIVSSAVTIALVAVIDPLAGAVLAASTLAAMAAIRVVVPWSVRRAGELTAQWRGDLSADVSQAVLAAQDLVAYGATDVLRRETRRATASLAAAQRRAAVVTGLGEAIVLLATGAAVATIAALSGGLAPVLVGVVVLAPLALVESLSTLAEAERLRPEIEGAEARLGELAVADAAITDPTEPLPLPASHDLRVHDLAVGWTSTVADGIELDLPAGDVIAVTGPSGSGKSTFAHTLARLVEPRGGQVLLGGVDIRDLAASDVRGVIGYLGQDEIVFDTTIRENLRIADPSADDQDMLRALSTAGLEDFVTSLPDGLGTRVGERGNRLSGGERQRLCLARLVLGGHRILVLDEPTEHLDEAAADAMLDDVLALAPGRSLVIVSHSPKVLERVGRQVLVGAEAVTAGR